MRHWLFVSCVLFAGCSKDEKAGDKSSTAAKAGATAPQPTTADKEAAKPAKQPFTAAWLGKTVAAPGEIGKVKLGMSVEEAKKLTPMADSPVTEESEIEGVSYAFFKDLDKKLTDVALQLPADKKAVIEEAWGKGQDADRGGKPVTVWFNPETGVRAAFSDEGDGKAYLRFEPYTPLAKLLGEGPQIAMLSKPFAGKTKEELAALYPELADKRGNIAFPATEWEFADDVNISPYPMDKPIESLAFSIPFNEKGEKKEAEIMEVIEKKWGKPKGKVEFSTDGAQIYNKKDPHIEVTPPGGYNRGKVTIRIGGK